MLMDNAQIRVELGVTKAAADAIIRWCAKRKGVVTGGDDLRKKYAYRVDVEAWVTEHTECAA
jgi:hypothetical protein